MTGLTHPFQPGTVFRVPTTHDVLTTLFDPRYSKSHLDLFNLGLLAFQLYLFAVLPRGASHIFFLFYFAFWRGAYDAGLGWVLTKQSKKKWIVREIQRLGWLDSTRHPKIRSWIKDQLVGKMGKDYSFDARLQCPPNFCDVLTDPCLANAGATSRIQCMALIPPTGRHYTCKVRA